MSRVRFAPSPTGILHVGNLEILLAHHIFIQENPSTKFILRIDFSGEYKTLDYAIIESFRSQLCRYLNYLGITNFECYCQYERKILYRSTLQNLKENCYVIEKDGIVYLQTNDEESNLEFEDEVFGKMKKNLDGLKYIALYDSINDKYLYNFASIVDDLDMGITHIIRGSDHLDNTFKQLLIYRALKKIKNEFIFPKVYSIPLCRIKNGEKLSKRAGQNDEYKLSNIIDSEKILVKTMLSYFFGDRTKNLSIKSISRISRGFRNVDISELRRLNTQCLRTLEYSQIRQDLAFFNKYVNEQDWNIVRENVEHVDEIDEILYKIYAIRTNDTSWISTDILNRLMKCMLNREEAQTVRERVFLGLRNNLKFLAETLICL